MKINKYNLTKEHDQGICIVDEIKDQYNFVYHLAIQLVIYLKTFR